ncbi:MAG: HDOD domain-containing protein [Candidatus Kapaibacteriota bacterium]
MKIINKIIKEIEEFPTLPTIYSTLSDVTANPRSTATDVANVIAQDQASATKVLKTSNSALYGYRGRINSISQAVVYIGFEEVKNLCIALSVIDMFALNSISKILSPVDLWKHSIAVGVISRYIARTLGVKNLEDYFVAGVVHDIGKLLFLKSIPEIYTKVLEYSIEHQVSLRVVEKEIIGISHTLAGKLLAEKWRLPKGIIEVISNQYIGVTDSKALQLVATVHLANVVATMLELGKAGDDLVPPINPKVYEVLKLHPNFFTRALPVIIKEYQESVNLLLIAK